MKRAKLMCGIFALLRRVQQQSFESSVVVTAVLWTNSQQIVTTIQIWEDICTYNCFSPFSWQKKHRQRISKKVNLHIVSPSLMEPGVEQESCHLFVFIKRASVLSSLNLNSFLAFRTFTSVMHIYGLYQFKARLKSLVSWAKMTDC